MIRRIILVNSIIGGLLVAALFVYPAVRGGLNILDPALKGAGIPQADWRLMQRVTPRYAAWARERVAAGQATSLSTSDISGTEWPLFGSVFYLWAIENLQKAWDAGDHRAGVEPKVYCQEAVLAASELVIDPNHASWVQKHWGTNYLHQENAFYRMLVIAALTSREKLLRDGVHLDLLRDQVETLSQEIDASRNGLLNDYPHQCYPGDVMTAIWGIKRADSVLGTDHSEFVRRALRGFVGPHNAGLRLPPYFANAESGAPIIEDRGCGNSYYCLTAPELWPDQAKTWFQNYETSFWQRRLGFVGFREFPKGLPDSDWTMNVDAGPVIAGFGVSANAFGVGAARKNGRFDLAYPLSLEMLTTAWELPDGTLALPRALSNVSDAPLLGEAAILWLLSVQPESGFPIRASGGEIPIFVSVVLLGGGLIGIWRMTAAWIVFKTTLRGGEWLVWAPILQIFLWLLFLAGALAAACLGHGLVALVLVLAALLFPRARRIARDKDAIESATVDVGR
ncbi:MAG TPA: hypothetical protein VMF06_19430 [Candidatus Limnocylindria bacterium]|nr:hypothetical protein [Candidatus Limnocylindria bacterium]